MGLLSQLSSWFKNECHWKMTIVLPGTSPRGGRGLGCKGHQIRCLGNTRVVFRGGKLECTVSKIETHFSILNQDIVDKSMKNV